MSEEPLALITGGTRGVGAAIALALGARGTASILTHRWGGSDEVELRRRFAEVGAPAPEIVEADAGNPEDTERLIAGIAAQKRRVDVFVSNVAVVSRGKGLDDLKLRSLTTSLRYSSWPLSNYLDALERQTRESLAANITFGGLKRFRLGGQLRSITWAFSASEVPTTQCSWNTERSRAVIPWDKRNLARAMRRVEYWQRQNQAAKRVAASRESAIKTQ